MAPLRRGRSSYTAPDFYDFIFCASFLINHSPLLLVGLCFQSLCAGIQYLVLCTVQTGSFVWKNLGAEKPENRYSFPSEVHDDVSSSPYVLSSGKNDLKSSKRLIEINDGDFALEGELQKTFESSAFVPNVKNRFDVQDNFSLLGIQEIVSHLAKCKSQNLDIVAAAEKKGETGFFHGLAFPSFWPAGEPGISSKKGTNFGDEDMNFHVPLTGKEMKVPEEHDWLCFQQETCKLKTTSCNQDSMSTPTKEPSDAGATQNKTSDSSQRGGQTLPDGGKTATKVSKSPKGSRNYSRSSSGDGGDDGDDDRKWNIPPGGCQGDAQCSMDDNKEPEQQPQEQSRKDNDHLCNQDSMSAPAEVPSDTGTNQDNKASNPGECQMSPDGGKPAAQVSKKGSTNYCRSSSGSGGDDGDDDRKKNVPAGGCQGNGHCDMDIEEESEQQTEALQEKDDGDDDDDDGGDDDGNEEKKRLPPMSDGISISGPAPDHGNTKSTGQGLRIDVSGARMFAQASIDLPEQCIESQEAAYGSFLSDQLNFRHPEAGELQHHEAENRLRSAFNCRHNLNSEREWEKCEEASCQEIQGFLSHSQNCRMHVLGGCETCIHYKNTLLFHTSRCHLPLGQCVIPKCDYIREYAKTSNIPDNKKWKYEHDQLFFRSSPPTTPTTLESQSSFTEAALDYHAFMAQLLQAEFHEGAYSLNTDYLASDGSLASFSGESLHDSSGAWNQYHVDRPPDVQVARGPAATEHVKIEQEQHEDGVLDESAAPLSVTCIPLRDTSQAVKSTEERGEVIWPLNKKKLSVGEDGAYLEGIHWMSVRFIGGGSCGRCFLCFDLETGFLFAIKKIPVEKFENNEIEIWGSLSGQHPNILELHGAVKYRQTVIIFMEYMSGGSVQEYAGRMNEPLAVHIFGKVLSAVAFMHHMRILHRDIKGGNVLLDDTGQQVKLADFGTSIRCDSYLQDNSPKGTEAFMAPEVCRSEYHSFSCDIWSLMCFLHQMLAGKPPWMEFCHGSLLFKIGTASTPPQSPPCSPEVEDLFSQGFVLAPAERATAAELLQHQVFTAAPYVANITLPSREEPEPELDLDEESSFSSDTSDSDTGSLVSEQSADPLMPASAIENCDSDEEEKDDDGDSDFSDDNDGSNGFQESDDGALFIEGPWQGLAMSAEEQLQSLQSDLFLSLNGNELEKLMNDIAADCDVNDNDVNLLTTEDFNVDQFIGHILSDADAGMASTQPLSAAAYASVSQEWSHSITGLTKLYVKDSNGKLLFTIRERPTTTYGSLGEEYHGNIASVLQLDAFSLTRGDGTLLNARAEIGSEEQAVRVVRAHDADNWQSYRWRVDMYGRVEQFFDI